MAYEDHRESTLGLRTGVPRMSYEDGNNYGVESKPKRNCCVRFCCCCCLSRKGALACALITILLLGGIGCAIFFLFPRVPQFTFKDVSYQDGSALTSDVSSKLERNSDGLISVPLSLNVDIKSENYIDIVVSNITVDGSLNGNKIGYGYLFKPASIKAHANTAFSLPFWIVYNTKDTSESNQNTLNLLKNSCGPNAKNKKLKLDYNAKFYIDLIKWTGYVPSIQNSFDFECPWDINSVIENQIGKKASDLINGLSKFLN